MASIEKGRTIRAMFHSSSKWVECIFYKALSLFSKIINKKFDIWNVNSLYFHFRLRKMTDKRQPGYISNGFEVTLSPLSHSLTPSFSLNLPFLLCLSPSPLSPSSLSPSPLSPSSLRVPEWAPVMGVAASYARCKLNLFILG